MYGAGMGWLQILTKSSGVPMLVWSRYGNQGINWFSAGVTLASSPDLVVSCLTNYAMKNLRKYETEKLKFRSKNILK